jgi:plastocyanin
MKQIRPSVLVRPLALCVAAALLLLGACGGEVREADIEAIAETDREVTIEGIAFEPNELTVSRGDTVVWTNEDDVDHTVTSGEAGDQGVPGVDKGTPAKPDGLFDDALERAGSTSSFAFDEAGTYPYFCRVHAAMKGVITVE